MYLCLTNIEKETDRQSDFKSCIFAVSKKIKFTKRNFCCGPFKSLIESIIQKYSSIPSQGDGLEISNSSYSHL